MTTHRWLRYVAVPLAALVFGAVAAAAESGGTGSAADNAEAPASVATTVAPVVIDGVTLFTVRGISAFPARERAAGIAARILQVARDASIPVDAIKAEERPSATAIVAGPVTIMQLFDPDSALESVDRQLLAGVFVQRIARAVADYRHDRTPQARIAATGYAIGALAALIVAIWALLKMHRRIDDVLERRYRARVESLQIKGFKLLHTEHLWNGLRSAIGMLHVLAGLVALYLALNFALAQFAATRGFAAGLLDLVLTPLVTIGKGLVAALPNLIFLAILVVVTRYVLKTLRLLFDALEQGRVRWTGFDADWAPPTYRIVRLMTIAFAIVVAYPYIPGSESAAFKGVSLFLGVIFSLGSSSIIANIIAGYSMTYRRAFRVGDRIKVGDVVGEVTEVRLQVTHVRSLKNEDIVIPNSTILASHVVNFSTLARRDGLILHTTVGIGYETPWRQVEAMLLAAAQRTPGVLADPAPFVLQTALGDFAVTYELNAYCNEPRAMNRIYTDLHRNILDVFNEYGVAIMTPAYVADPEQAKLVPKEQWFLAPARAPDAGKAGA